MDTLFIDFRFEEGTPELGSLMQDLEVFDLNTENILKSIDLRNVNVLEKSFSNKHRYRIKVDYTAGNLLHVLAAWKTNPEIEIVTKDKCRHSVVSIFSVSIEKSEEIRQDFRYRSSYITA